MRTRPGGCRTGSRETCGAEGATPSSRWPQNRASLSTTSRELWMVRRGGRCGCVDGLVGAVVNGLLPSGFHLSLSLSLPPSLPPSLSLSAVLPSSPHKAPKQRGQVFKEGTPLPESGTCTHYKKSHRWLRSVHHTGL